MVVNTTPEDYEYASDLLWGLGVVAISEHWTAEGRVELRTSLGEDEKSVRDAMRATGLEFGLEYVDSSVADTWRAHAHPVRVGEGVVVSPAWCSDDEIAAVVPSEAGTTQVSVVRIEPGSTFGLGDHPTTSASLALVERYLEPGSTVLDVGCGSGVLGVVALVLGASRAHGVDINPASPEVSVANARLNGVADRWTVSTDPLEVIGRPFDLVVANILAPTLVELADQLVRLTDDDGVLIVSGVLDGRYDHVIDALSPMREIEKVVVDGWAASVLGR